MGSPGCDQVVSTTTHLPLYTNRNYTDNMRAWPAVEEDIKPFRFLSATPERSWPGAPIPCWDRQVTEDPSWLAKITEAAAPNLLPSKVQEQCSVVHNQGVGPPCVLEGQVEERCLEQVQTMVVGEVLKDIETACKLLNIAADPMDWSCVHVQKWLLWTEHLYRLPQVSKGYQELTGKDLCSLSVDDFRQRSLQCGDMLHAHLDIWKSAAGMKDRYSPGDCRLHDIQDQWPEADSSCSSQPIHLWQFLKELLLKPQNYGRSIRWLNKEKGIFKIEDSAYIARLWGIRKNRPAMNYDKLSRSIRQYYKKGIIRKPDVSRRLVYQFVKPV